MALVYGGCGPGRYDPYAGWTTEAKQAALMSAQQALMDLSMGNKGEAFAYTQGDGAKSVTYTRADMGTLQNLIQSLKGSLGLCGGRRGSRGFTYL
jgi:hypothetical protein